MQTKTETVTTKTHTIILSDNELADIVYMLNTYRTLVSSQDSKGVPEKHLDLVVEFGNLNRGTR